MICAPGPLGRLATIWTVAPDHDRRRMGVIKMETVCLCLAELCYTCIDHMKVKKKKKKKKTKKGGLKQLWMGSICHLRDGCGGVK